MRFLVSCGMDRAEGESLSTAETVPGVRPKCCATALSVMTCGFWPGFLTCTMGAYKSFLVIVSLNCPEIVPDTRQLSLIAHTPSPARMHCQYHTLAYRSLLGLDPLKAKYKMYK